MDFTTPYWNNGSYYSYPSYTNVEVDILSTSNHPVRKYSLEGKTFIEGKKGSEFSIRIKNPNSMRVEVIVSVDGLCVIDGKKAHSNSRAYVIAAYDNLVIEGWRINNDEVRKFFFTEKENSYSGLKNGEEENCGIISVLAYAEYVKPTKITWAVEENYLPCYNTNVVSKGTNMTLSANSDTPSRATKGMSNAVFKSQVSNYSNQVKSEINLDSFDLGTGMGKKQESKVVGTYFNRDRFLGKTSIFYASRSSLTDMGIDVEKKPMVKLPQGFTDFCEEI